MVGLTVGLMFATWAGFTVGQSSIDALLFAKYGVDELPVLYLFLGALLFVASLGITALLGRVPGRDSSCCCRSLLLRCSSSVG